MQQKTAIDVYQWLHEVCTTRLITTGPIVLGGPGIVVQMDESLFGISLSLCIYIPMYSYRLNIFYLFKIIEEELQAGKCGILGWWIHLTLLL